VEAIERFASQILQKIEGGMNLELAGTLPVGPRQVELPGESYFDVAEQPGL